MGKVEVVYDTEFFRRQSTGSRRSALVILEIVFGWLAPRQIVDVGCGVGTWLAAARELGVESILGIDGAHVDPSALQIPAESFAEVDLENEPVETAMPAGASFDLVICMEVAEHLSFHRAPSFVHELASLGDAVLFSAAVPYQAGTNHINEQWPEFWAILFEAEGFVCLDAIRDRIWYDRDVEWWYRQNALLFVRRGSGSHDRIVAATAGEIARPALSRVHAENLLFQVLNAFRPHRAAAREEEVDDLHAVLSAYARGTRVLPPFSAVSRAELRPDADNVFPRTRTIVSEPERDEARLQDRARAAEVAYAAATEALAAAQAFVQARGTELEVTRDLLDERQSQLDQTRGLLDERQSQLDHTRELLHERQGQLDHTRDLLDERQSQLDQTRNLLHERQGQLDHTRNILQERQLSIDLTRAERDDAARQLGSARAALNERNAAILELNLVLGERSNELDAARRALVDQTQRVDHLGEVLGRQEALLDSSRALTEQGRRDLEVAHHKVAELRHGLRRIPRLIRRIFGSHFSA